MIRFSAFLVVVAVGVLVAGVVTSKLLLVYIAIGVSGVALLALGIGAAVNWRELAGQPKTAHPGTVEPGTVETSAQGPAPQTAVPERVTAPAAAGAGHVGVTSSGVAPAGSGWPVTTPPASSSPSPVGYLPAAGQSPGSRPPDTPRAPAAFTPRREHPAPGVWEWRDDAIQTPSAPGQPSGSGRTSPRKPPRHPGRRRKSPGRQSPSPRSRRPPARRRPSPRPPRSPRHPPHPSRS